MSLADLSALGSFISGIAVVVTLIVLILQMRQASQNQRATIHFQRLAVVQDALLQLSSPELASLQLRGSAGDLSLTTEQTWQYLMVTRNTFRLFEEFFYQHRDGMLDHARWANNVRRFRLFSMAPGFRAAWRTEAASHEKDFADWVESVFLDVASSTTPTMLIDVWRECVQAAQTASR
ncbi:MAG: hypothetical protein ABL973_12100 [Micropepsaceae bacterium]